MFLYFHHICSSLPDQKKFKFYPFWSEKCQKMPVFCCLWHFPRENGQNLKLAFVRDVTFQQLFKILNFLQGTCFSTRGARQRNMIVQAGDANSFTIVTMHDQVTPFDVTFLSPRLVGAQGKHVITTNLGSGTFPDNLKYCLQSKVLWSEESVCPA